MIHVCRCCNNEVRRHIEVVVSVERPRPGMHSSGRAAANACDDCVSAISDGILHVAQLWRPEQQCTHITPRML